MVEICFKKGERLRSNILVRNKDILCHTLLPLPQYLVLLLRMSPKKTGVITEGGRKTGESQTEGLKSHHLRETTCRIEWDVVCTAELHKSIPNIVRLRSSRSEFLLMN